MVSGVSQTGKQVLEYSVTLGIVAMEGRGFEYPTDVVIGNNGRLYVPNRSRNSGERSVRITVLDMDSEYHGIFATFGHGEGYLVSPMCAAGDEQNQIYITDDATNKVSIFDYEGNFVSRWGVHGTGDGELNGPSGIAFDSAGDVYVADTQNNRVQKFSAAGEFLSGFGTGGSGEGQFDLPWGVTVSSDGDVFVADWGNDRIQKFTSDGEFVAAYGTSGRGDGQLLRPSGVVVDERGYIYVSDWGNERVQVFDSEGAFLQKLRGEATLSKWAALYLDTNKEEGETRAMSDLEPSAELIGSDDPHTQSAHIEKYFWAPMSVKLDDAGSLYVTDGNRHRIQVYKRVS